MGAAYCAPVRTLSCQLSHLVCALVLLGGACGCSDSRSRVFAESEPRSGFLRTDYLISSRTDEQDILLVVDNSASMADKQELLLAVLPDLIGRLVLPPCYDDFGRFQQTDTWQEPCPDGTPRPYDLLNHTRVAVITTSLALPGDCSEELGVDVDQGHLLGSLPRARDLVDELPAMKAAGFLEWTPTSRLSEFSPQVRALLERVGHQGCRVEAPLEAAYRFLVDPAPVQSLVRRECDPSDEQQRCYGPALDDNGAPLVDEEVLKQRASFLRPESILRVLVIGDENDCSMGAVGRLLPPSSDDGEELAPERSCLKPDSDEALPNLTPIERYGRGFSEPQLCFKTEGLSPERCVESELTESALFDDLTVEEGDGRVRAPPRPSSLVRLAAVVGLPWQDVAENPSPLAPLSLRPARESLFEESIQWQWLLGDGDEASSVPEDPLMRQQRAPREGVNPATGIELSPPNSGALANPINGHERNIQEDDVQSACIYPLVEARDCAEVGCKCGSELGEGDPICQSPDGSYGEQQRWASARPGTRQIAVVRELSEHSSTTGALASLCAKTQDPSEVDFGLRPLADLLDRGWLFVDGGHRCAERLELAQDGTANCVLLEAADAKEWEPSDCEMHAGRLEPSEFHRDLAEEQLRSLGYTDADISRRRVCELRQASKPEELEACLSSAPDFAAWCYADPAQGNGSAELVEQCPEAKKHRFVFSGWVPASSSVTLLLCADSD